MVASSNTDAGVRAFLNGLVARDRVALASVLAEDTTLFTWAWDRSEGHRPREEAIDGLLAAAHGWSSNSLEVLGLTSTELSAAAHFRVQSRDERLPMDTNGSVFLDFEAGRISRINLYLALPHPAASREGIVRSVAPGPGRDALVESLYYRWDARESFPPGSQMVNRPAVSLLWSKVAHPGSNLVHRVNWTSAEADERIVETLNWFRERGLGIQWTVSPYDSPGDLGERLERHGFIRAGDQALMLRFGLDTLEDMPLNTGIDLVELQQRPDLWEPSLQISAQAFHWPPEQTEKERDGWFQNLRSEVIRSYVALVEGRPVAFAHLYLQAGVAYLGGAATHPEYRGRKIYSTLLRKRLERARDEGYEVAMLFAEPMSRRVVSQFGFEICAMFDVYGWMEPMDLNVIRNLVVDD